MSVQLCETSCRGALVVSEFLNYQEAERHTNKMADSKKSRAHHVKILINVKLKRRKKSKYHSLELFQKAHIVLRI